MDFATGAAQKKLNLDRKCIANITIAAANMDMMTIFIISEFLSSHFSHIHPGGMGPRWCKGIILLGPATDGGYWSAVGLRVRRLPIDFIGFVAKLAIWMNLSISLTG